MASNANAMRNLTNTEDASAIKQENLQLKMRIAELERLVLTDTLTPLYNRRHFMEF